MILFWLFFSLENKIDSLKTLLNQTPEINIVLEINKYYLVTNEYENGIRFLKNYEKDVALEEKPIILYHIGDDYLFAGKMIEARNMYLKLVGRFPRSTYANDALARLHLIEDTRRDTILLKRLVSSICLYETEQFNIAEDSIKNLLKTKIASYAYYYLALLYETTGELSLALSALVELNESCPEHRVYDAHLLHARINLKLDNEKDARQILEDIMIREPNSIYAVRAREMLKEINKK
jgi:tetratricopeptide (TPR) repeat protein